MPYQSPLHILDSLQISPDDLNGEGIVRLRKKLLSEFNLASDITINVNGKEYTKDAILKVIDALKETENLTLHKEIFSRKSLLNWLENPVKGNFPYELAEEVLEINDSHEYQNILQESLLEAVRLHFRKRDFATTTNLLRFLSRLSDIYGYVVYDLLYDEIYVIIESIEIAQNNPNVGQDRETFGFITEPEWTDFLNTLPDYFEETRERYCYAAVNYTVAVQKKDRNWTYEISSQLDQTLCDENIKRTISSNHEIYTRNFRGKGEGWSWSWLWIIAVVLMNLGKMKSCSNDYSSRTSNSTSYRDYSSSGTTPYEPSPYPGSGSQSEPSESSIKIPANTFYILEIQDYQKKLIKQGYGKGGDKINIMPNEDLLSNMNVGNTEEKIDTQEMNNPQMVNFVNNSDYDLVIFKAGCIANRSYYVRSKETFPLQCCNGDKLYFYFGKEWRQIHTRTDRRKDIEAKRFQGYFSQPHLQTNGRFLKEYTITTNTATTEASVTFFNTMLDLGIPPHTIGSALYEFDTSINLQ
jgi:hypothetical protein